MPHSYRKEEQLLHNTQIKRSVLDLESGGTECHQKLDRNEIIPIEKRSNCGDPFGAKRQISSQASCDEVP